MTITVSRNAKQGSNYWLCLLLDNDGDSDNISSGLASATAIDWRKGRGFLAADLGTDWVGKWTKVKDTLPSVGATDGKLALVPASSMPSLDEVKVSARSISDITRLAENYWLIDYLENDRIECHFQSVVDQTGDVCGWESFARVQLESGELISGFKIIEASKALNIKHMVDRHLHVISVRDFSEFKLKGNLFINFIPDFIQRPEKYLEGLEEAAKRYSILTRRLVLEFPAGVKALNMPHIKALVLFCRTKGFQISLDNISDPVLCETLISELVPDFIKLDRTLSGNLAANGKAVGSLIGFAHSKNCMVVAEGIENKETFDELKKLGADQFQGYFFSKPERPKKPQD